MTKIMNLFRDENDDHIESLRFTSFHMAVLGLRTVGLEQVLEIDPSRVNECDAFGRTALGWAALCKQITNVRVLLHWGAKHSSADHLGKTPLHWVAAMNSYSCIEALLQSGCSSNARDVYGRTALHEAVKSDSSAHKAMRILLNYGADIEAMDDLGRTPLHLASYHGKVANVHALLDLGADIEARSGYYETPILKAIAYNKPETVRALRDRGARLDVFDFCQDGILHITAQEGCMEIMQILAEARIQGLDVHAQDSNGRSAEDYFVVWREDLYRGQKAPPVEERAAFDALIQSINVQDREPIQELEDA